MTCLGKTGVSETKAGRQSLRPSTPTAVRKSNCGDFEDSQPPAVAPGPQALGCIFETFSLSLGFGLNAFFCSICGSMISSRGRGSHLLLDSSIPSFTSHNVFLDFRSSIDSFRIAIYLFITSTFSFQSDAYLLELF